MKRFRQVLFALVVAALLALQSGVASADGGKGKGGTTETPPTQIVDSFPGDGGD